MQIDIFQKCLLLGCLLTNLVLVNSECPKSYSHCNPGKEVFDFPI